MKRPAPAHYPNPWQPAFRFVPPYVPKPPNRYFGWQRESRRTYNPWEVDMTLCIAALCYDERTGEDCAVVAFDRRVESDVASAETEFKFTVISDQWFGLLAGPLSQCRELSALFSQHLSEVIFDGSNILEVLREPVRRLRRRLADDHTQRLAAMSYDEFLTDGREQLSPEFHRQIEFDISNQRIEAELILIGYLDHGVGIFLCRDGEVTQRYDFAAIGSRTTIAETVLYQRSQSRRDDLSRTLYTVFEAKTLGSIAPGVGRDSTVMLVAGDLTKLRGDFLSGVGNRLLKEMVGKYGPKPVPATLDLPIDKMFSRFLQTMSKNHPSSAMMSETLQRRSVTPAAIAGVTRRVW